jgi:CubicO group peptidase (beta-lactamase class C family)
LFTATDHAIQLDSREAEHHLIPAACLAKPVTATLLAQMISTQDFNWSNEISDLLAVARPWKARLAGISLQCLLNHTHGLDVSAIQSVPRTREGFLDVEALCSQLAATPLSSPGRLYSYSNAGAWFAGAVLERFWGRPYSHVLEESALWPSVTKPKPIFRGICPATGEGLELTVSQWLDFLEIHLRNASARDDDAIARTLASLRVAPVPLPGWNPSEQGACLGWKYFGAGWFGHNANLIGSSTLLRFNPEHHIAIVVEASDDAAFIVLAGLFGTALPEFANLRPPRLLNAEECAAASFEHYVGTYVQAQSALRVNLISKGPLLLIIDTHGGRATSTEHTLRAAEDNLFIPEPRDDPEFAFVQFVEANAGAFGYLWNGKQLWRRE